MFKIVIGLSLFLSALLIACLILPITEKDRKTFHELLESSNPGQKTLLTFSEQAREGVTKELWYTRENDPLNVHIESKHSELFFFQQEGSIEVIEQLEGITSLMQEELYYDDGKPMQLVRYMEAKRATYNYNTQLFIAEDAKLWKYRAPGHEPLQNVSGLSPLMAGAAQTIEFTMKGRDLCFQAHRLNATFHEKEGTFVKANDATYNGEKILLTGEVRVENTLGRVDAERAMLTRDPKKLTKIEFPWIELNHAITFTLPDGNQLFCERLFLDYTQKTSRFTGTPQVRYIDKRGEIRADRATMDFRDHEGEIQPTRVTLLGNVQLIYSEENQYALAEQVTYFPDQQLMVLEGKENRVLFFDKARNMQLSAYEVRAVRDAETKKDSIQGVGDVRFLFAQEELTKLKERFRW